MQVFKIVYAIIRLESALFYVDSLPKAAAKSVIHVNCSRRFLKSLYQMTLRRKKRLLSWTDKSLKVVRRKLQNRWLIFLIIITIESLRKVCLAFGVFFFLPFSLSSLFYCLGYWILCFSKFIDIFYEVYSCWDYWRLVLKALFKQSTVKLFFFLMIVKLESWPWHPHIIWFRLIKWW